MQKTVVVGNDKNNLWFDHECREKRQSLRETLRKYNKSYNMSKLRIEGRSIQKRKKY